MPICQSHIADRERFALTPPISTVISTVIRGISSTPTHRWKGSKGAARASACMGATQWWHLLLWYYFRTAPARGPSSSHMVTDSSPGEQSECFSALPSPFPGFAIPLARPITPREIVNGDGQHHREDVCSKEDNIIRCKLPFYYRRHVDPSKSNLNCTRPLSTPGQALRAFL